MMDEKKIREIHKMAQIALGKQVDIDCTKWAIKEGLFDNFEALYNAGYRLQDENAELQKQVNEFQEKIKHGTLIDTTKYFIRTEEYKPYQTRYIICKYGVHTDVYNFYTDKEKAERDLEMIYNV
jgi:hypothetical protein